MEGSIVRRRELLTAGSATAITAILTGPARAGQVQVAQAGDTIVSQAGHAALFEPFRLADGMTLRNRLVMAPMTTWASNDDATISDAEVAHYRRRAKDVGLVITGCSRVTANGIGFTGEFASHEDRFIPSLRRLADAAKSGGAPAILQIYHAGNKAVPELVRNGDVVSASAVLTEPGPFSRAITTRALEEREIEEIVAAFGAATHRAIEAGFDGVELHGAHGFLLQNFFSPYYNRRDDQWGGSLENRLRFPLAVVREVKRVIGAHALLPFVLGYRISPEEPGEGRLRIEDTYRLIDRLIAGGADYLHFSLTSILDSKPVQPADDRLITLLLRKVANRVPVISAGQIRTPAQAKAALELGLPLVAVAQGLVMNPDWVALARDGKEDAIVQDIAESDVARLDIPPKLWNIIESTPGWFKLR